MNIKIRILLLIFTVLIINSLEISSQESNKIVYDQKYFQKFNITTAADALKRIPGVEELSRGAEDRFDPSNTNKKRGFGSSGTQILINGERQSSKSNNIIKTLERINAEALIRVEVIRGSEAGLDVRSEGVIVNIIVDASSSAGSGTWNSALRFLSSGNSIWSGSGSWAKKIKNTDLVLGLERTSYMNSRMYDEFHVDKSQSILQYRLRETIEYEAKNRFNIDINSKINGKNTIRINALLWFDGKENEPEVLIKPESVCAKSLSILYILIVI